VISDPFSQLDLFSLYTSENVVLGSEEIEKRVRFERLMNEEVQ
jgi:hypothetical protein